MDELRKKYGNDLRIVYKQFVVHPQVATAGALAFCAAAQAEQGRRDGHAALGQGLQGPHNFDKDEPPAPTAGAECWDSPDGCPVVLGFAKELELDETKFKADMKDCQPQMQKDMRSCRRSASARPRRSSSTAASWSGAMPMENFQR